MPPTPPRVEGLEVPPFLTATATLDDGLLTIDGTEAADSITVARPTASSPSAAPPSPAAGPRPSRSRRWTTSSSARYLGGNDKIKLDKLSVDAMVDAGAGNDARPAARATTCCSAATATTAWPAARATTKLLGGAGRDRLDGGAGDDELSGGEGLDRIAGGSGFDSAEDSRDLARGIEDFEDLDELPDAFVDPRSAPCSSVRPDAGTAFLPKQYGTGPR